MKTFIALLLVTLSAGAFACAHTGGARPLKGGAELWSENCIRCHNSRSPSEHSDGEWDTIVLHMRVRANLGADDAQAIAEFLKSAN